LDDFSKVLELTSGEFDKAIMMMAKIHNKDGNFAQARSTLDTYALKVPGSPAVDELMSDIRDAQAAAKKASSAKRAQLWTACSEAATQALRVASHSTEIRQIRAECNLAGGDPQGAVVDLSRLSHLSYPTTSSLMRIFRLAYFLLTPSQSSSSHTSHLSPLKQCLHLDPDSPSCKPAYRLVKSLDKGFASLDKLIQGNDWIGVVKHVAGPSREFPGDGFAATFEDALNKHGSPDLLSTSSGVPIPDPRVFSPRRAHIIRSVCRAYTRLNLAKKGEAWCDLLLTMSEDALKAANEMMAEGSAEVDGLVGKGEALLIREDWAEAVRVFERAAEASGRSDRDVLNRLQKSQRLMKQSKQKDYYKVLGVARDADAKTIKKAYRKAVLTAHPDKGGTEAKMATVNEAYEVLSNFELRQRFDNGDDPNDPNSQGGHPFAGFQGGFPGFGGGEHPFAQFFQSGGRGSFKHGH
jgi:DnaJ family protein C protein 3